MCGTEKAQYSQNAKSEGMIGKSLAGKFGRITWIVTRRCHLTLIAETQKAKWEESFGLYDLESYLATSLSSLAQWKLRWPSDHAIQV